MISGWAAVRLVARREIVTRGREKSFFISLGVTLVVIAAIIFLPQVFGGGDERATVFTTAGGVATADAARAAGDRFDVELSVRRVDSDAAARARLDDDDGALALVEDGRRVVVGADAPEEALQAVQGASRDARTQQALRDAGVGPADARRILAPAPLAVTDLNEGDDALLAFAFVALFLLYGQILAYGLTVATGVVEEKASRIVEILLATIQPRELLAGKVLGVGLLAFAQLLVIGAVGLVLAAVSGQVDVGAAELGALPILLAFFVLGFALYACAYAMGGALVARQEEIQNVTTPLTIIMVAVFVVGIQGIQDPGGPLAQALSIAPFSSPLVMPVRLIAGSVPAWEVVLSVALSLVAIAIVVRLAARMYGNAVLQTSGRVSLASVLRQGT